MLQKSADEFHSIQGHPGTHGGFGFETVNRRAYYDKVHPQTIAFEIAREIVKNLTETAEPQTDRPRHQSRGALFSQVLAIVQDYIAARVDFKGCNPREIGLQTYAQRIASLLTAAILPADGGADPPILPRLNRYQPIGSTENVYFKTVKPVQATHSSHLNYVARDTNSWEQAAAFQPEQLAKDGQIISYARNDHLEFNIPYELYGVPHVYEPDFLLKLTNGTSMVLEIKSYDPEGTEAKHQAAQRWVQAVNYWGKLGRWGFGVGREMENISRICQQ